MSVSVITTSVVDRKLVEFPFSSLAAIRICQISKPSGGSRSRGCYKINIITDLFQKVNNLKQQRPS